jgi:hypothetical protein
MQRELVMRRVQIAALAVLWIGEFAKREQQVLRKTARSAKVLLHLLLAFPEDIRCWSLMWDK